MKSRITILFILFGHAVLFGQKDSIYQFEIGIGTPVFPILYNGVRDGPVLHLEFMREEKFFLSSMNISYKINMNENKKVRTGISYFQVPGYFSYSRPAYYFLVNCGMERAISDDGRISLSYGYTLLCGYWKLYDYVDSSKDIDELNSFLLGPGFGLTVKGDIGTRWFWECETYLSLLISYSTGKMDYHTKGPIPNPPSPEKNYFWDGNFIFSNLLGINVGYKF